MIEGWLIVNILVKSGYYIDPVGSFFCYKHFGLTSTFVISGLDSAGRTTTGTTSHEGLNAHSIRVIYEADESVTTSTTPVVLESPTTREASAISSTSLPSPTSQPPSEDETNSRRYNVGLAAGLGVTAGLCIILGIVILALLKKYRKRAIPSPEKAVENSYEFYNQGAHQNFIWLDVPNQRGELENQRPVQELESHSLSNH